ncbi:uncharacterized protein LOC128744701 [Sabethes cyaneus]|uniref:uncharacterized protein LOC128744701 n=1 Tax=Sabethes cyaneus TaxID=53552 RepID=UPI00237E8459|nr:uncharacterized protein LOC128744701 [Sabethes cyaneus]
MFVKLYAFCLNRLFSSVGKSTSVQKQSRVLRKLLRGSNLQKEKWYAEKNPAVSIGHAKAGGRESHRRSAVLNTLFMEQITNLLSTGKHSEDLLCYGIHISRVKISVDFHCINVFWFSSCDANDDEIGILLKRISGSLRHELAQLKLIGLVPRLTFTKDKAYSYLNGLDSVLKQADYGEFIRHDPVLVLKNETEFYTELSPEVRKEIVQLEDESWETLDTLPVMRNDVYGIDHFTIMHDIKTSLKKFQPRVYD